MIGGPSWARCWSLWGTILAPKAQVHVGRVIRGHTVVESLNTVQYDERQLKRWMKQQVDVAIKANRLKPGQAMRLLDDYERGLRDYTYLSV